MTLLLRDYMILRMSEERMEGHILGCRVLDVHLTQNCVAVVGHHNLASLGQNHLEHGLGTQAGADDVRDGLGEYE